MENETLISYIEGQVRAGAKKADIQEALLAVGWSEDDVSMAYARALVVSGVPVPEGDGKSLAMRKSIDGRCDDWVLCVYFARYYSVSNRFPVL